MPWRIIEMGGRLKGSCKPQCPQPSLALGPSWTQTFGDWPDRYHPLLHVLTTDGCFYGDGMYRVAPRFNVKDLEKLFRHSVLYILLRKGKSTREFIGMI